PPCRLPIVVQTCCAKYSEASTHPRSRLARMRSQRRGCAHGRKSNCLIRQGKHCGRMSTTCKGSASIGTSPQSSSPSWSGCGSVRCGVTPPLFGIGQRAGPRRQFRPVCKPPPPSITAVRRANDVTRLWLIAAGLWLAAILPAGAQTGWESLYSTEALSKEKPRLEERVNELFRRLNTLFSAAEKSAFARVEFEVPLRDPTGNPLNFFAHGTVRAPRVTMPVQSLLFVEDLSTAYAWLHLNGYSLETVDEYITLLKYKTPADFPSRRYPPPLTALGIPRDASGDRRVDELSLRFRNSAYAHELGHVLLQ